MVSGIIILMNFKNASHKEIGHFGERATAEYFKKHGFRILDRNVARKTGELDIVIQKENVVHIVEVKSIACDDFPNTLNDNGYLFNPADNLHSTKIRKVVRTGEWYIAEKGWEGEWQVDGAIVWIRRRDGVARVRYLPHIV